MNSMIKQSTQDLMLKNYVYFFSGTGNSFYVAKKIALGIGAELRPIVSLTKDDIIDADVLCFVFPLYEFKPPLIVTQIINNLSKINAKITIAIATYGVSLYNSLKHFEKCLKRKNVLLSQGYGIKSPHNAMGSTGLSDVETEKRLNEIDQKITRIMTNIQSRAVLKVERNSIFEDGTIILQLPYIIKLMSILIFKGTKSLSFTVTDDCIGCKLCQRICPVNVIDWVEGKPSFGKDCVSCFACLQWCPTSAIQFGHYTFDQLSIKHYHHPLVTAEDLITDDQLKAIK